MQVAIEFDCDVEGDGEDGWEDDLEDESDQEPGQALQQADGEGGDEENEEDMIGPGKKQRDALFWGDKYHRMLMDYLTATTYVGVCCFGEGHGRGYSSYTIPGTWQAGATCLR